MSPDGVDTRLRIVDLSRKSAGERNTCLSTDRLAAEPEGSQKHAVSRADQPERRLEPLLQRDLLAEQADGSPQRRRQAALADELVDERLARSRIRETRGEQRIEQAVDVAAGAEVGQLLRIARDVARRPERPDGERPAMVERNQVRRAEEPMLPPSFDGGKRVRVPSTAHTVRRAGEVLERILVVLIAAGCREFPLQDPAARTPWRERFASERDPAG